jgi:regulator of sigma E protease
VKISGMNPDEDLPDEVRTRAYYSQPVWKRIVVIAAGPAVNLVLAFVLLLVFFTLIGPQGTTRKVGTIDKSFPAHGVLRSGDELTSVDGRRGDVVTLSRQIQRHRCAERPPVNRCRATTPATIVVRRDGRLRSFRLTPIYDPLAARTRLGFSYEPGPRDTLAFGPAVSTSAKGFWFITKGTLSLPARLFNSQRRKEISGVVGSYEVTRQTILTNLANVVQILAVISLSLAIVNLFPFLPLDGGHIFWALVEKVRRKPVPFSVMERAGVVGFMLVIGLFLLGLTNDINRLSGQGFQVR